MASNARPMVQVASRFQRSVQLESDLAREDALDGYVLHGSGELALETTARYVASSQQRAFTWTGPYGGASQPLPWRWRSCQVVRRRCASGPRLRLVSMQPAKSLVPSAAARRGL